MVRGELDIQSKDSKRSIYFIEDDFMEFLSLSKFVAITFYETADVFHFDRLNISKERSCAATESFMPSI